MTASWTRTDDGEWAVKITDAPWPQGTGVGLSTTVVTSAGRKTQVVLGEHLRCWRVKGGRFVDVYAVDCKLDANGHRIEAS